MKEWPPRKHSIGIVEEDDDNGDDDYGNEDLFSDEDISVIAKKTESFQINDTTLAYVDEEKEDNVNEIINNRKKNRMSQYQSLMQDYEIAFNNLLTHFMHPFCEFDVFGNNDDVSRKTLRLETIYANTKAFGSFISSKIDVPLGVLLDRKPRMGDVYQLKFEQQHEKWHFRLNKVLNFMMGSLKIKTNHIFSKDVVVEEFVDVYRPEVPATVVTENKANTAILEESSSSAQRSASDSNISAVYLKLESEIKTSKDHNITEEAVISSFLYLRRYWQTRKPLPLVGIKNTNLNCCLTSIIQCLFRSRHFRDILVDDNQKYITEGDTLLARLRKVYDNFVSATPGQEALDCSDLAKV